MGANEPLVRVQWEGAVWWGQGEEQQDRGTRWCKGLTPLALQWPEKTSWRQEAMVTLQVSHDEVNLDQAKKTTGHTQGGVTQDIAQLNAAQAGIKGGAEEASQQLPSKEDTRLRVLPNFPQRSPLPGKPAQTVNTLSYLRATLSTQRHMPEKENLLCNLPS